MDTVGRDDPVDVDVDQHPVAQVEQIRQRVHREVAAERPAQSFLGAEDEPSDRRVQSVGTDHQIEPARCRVLERHVDPRAVVVQGRDRVAEQILDVRAGRVVQDPRQFAAEDLDVLARPRCRRSGGRRSRRPGVHRAAPLS